MVLTDGGTASRGTHIEGVVHPPDLLLRDLEAHVLEPDNNLRQLSTIVRTFLLKPVLAVRCTLHQNLRDLLRSLGNISGSRRPHLLPFEGEHQVVGLFHGTQHRLGPLAANT